MRGEKHRLYIVELKTINDKGFNYLLEAKKEHIVQNSNIFEYIEY